MSRKTFWIHLRGGRTIELEAEDCKTTYSTETGLLTHFEFPGADTKRRYPFYISPQDILAIESSGR